MNKNDLNIFYSEGPEFFDRNITFIAVSRSYEGENAIIGIGSYEKGDHLIKSWKTATGLPHFDYKFIKISGVLFLFYGKNKGNTFPDNGIPSTLVFSGILDGSFHRIGYKLLEILKN